MVSEENKKNLLKHKKEIEKGIRIFKFNRILFGLSILIYGLASIFIDFESPMILFAGTSIIYTFLLIMNEINLADFTYALEVLEEWEKENVR
jgi:hypothetical protein